MIDLQTRERIKDVCISVLQWTELEQKYTCLLPRAMQIAIEDTLEQNIIERLELNEE